MTVALDALRIVQVLNRHGVDYVVIGGYAAVLYGSPRATEDLNITPGTDVENLRRLASALIELGAELLPPDSEPIPWDWSAESLRRFTTVTTRTSAGDLDLAFSPDAPDGGHFDYARLARRAVVVSLPPDVPVADLHDVIASKQASGRPKDQATLPELRDLLARHREGPRRGEHS